MEAWPVAGSVGCLLEKQAPGPGGAVDAFGCGYAPARFLILFTQTHPHARTRTHTHIHAHIDTRIKEAEVCAH